MSYNSKLQQAVVDCTRDVEQGGPDSTASYLTVRTKRHVVSCLHRSFDAGLSQSGALQELLVDPISRDEVYQVFCARALASLDQCAPSGPAKPCEPVTLAAQVRMRARRHLLRTRLGPLCRPSVLERCFKFLRTFLLRCAPMLLRTLLSLQQTVAYAHCRYVPACDKPVMP